MASTKISNKYQVVIPKSVREKLGLKEGQELNAYALKKGAILLTPKEQLKWPDDYIGSESDIWQDIDIDQYIENEQNSWE